MDKILKAKNAQSFLNNASFQEAVLMMNEYLDAKMLGCKFEDKDEAERLILSKQLLQGIVRELNRFVSDGDFEEYKLREAEPIRREFSR